MSKLPSQNSRVALVSDDKPKQDCARCPQIRKCWDTSRNPSDAALAINLLVCRIKLGLNVERSTRTLLRMLRPQTVTTANWIVRTVGGLELDDVIAETESAIIEYILRSYNMGERAWPLQYLFGRPNGVIRGWSMHYMNRIRRYRFTHMQWQQEDDDELNSLNMQATHRRIKTAPDQQTTAFDDTENEDYEVDPAVRAVDDGVTLPLREYRVMKFCLTNADTQSTYSPAMGLHTYLAGASDVQRSTITKWYRQGQYRLIEALGQTDVVLARRGIRVVEGLNRDRRTMWIQGAPCDVSLTQAEIRGLLNEAAHGAATLNDICWAYGISKRYYYKMREKAAREN